MQQEFGGQLESRNGLTQEMITNAMHHRQNRQVCIKNALSSVDLLIRNFKYSFMKQNPNLLVPNGGLLMMREKSTMEVI